MANLSVCRSLHSECHQENNGLKSEIQILNATNIQLCSDVQSYLQRVKENVCAPGWKLYNDTCYFISAKKTSYGNAKRACEVRGAKLLEINSNEEKDFFIRKTEEGKYYRIGRCFPNTGCSSNDRFVEYSGKPCSGGNCGRIGFICQTDAIPIPEILSGLRNICSKIRASIES
ncbi:C-type lectin domain family 12 member B-like [Amblyraja radiata]|uniref:C-type lectin domain family 12 member B-like n=1 Tax=Amblyraja radiata TaxID=386614 RepID=UPI0014031058|nr:C-type lectin domain family 12 member B-like [Amblyraja radiata]